MFLDTIGSTGLNTIRQNGPVLYGVDFMDISDTIAATQADIDNHTTRLTAE